jgi:hypothetical protein
VAGHRSALNLGEEAGAKHPLERAPGVVWPEAEQKGGAELMFFEQAQQGRYAFERAPQGIDIDFERKNGHGIRQKQGGPLRATS